MRPWVLVCKEYLDKTGNKRSSDFSKFQFNTQAARNVPSRPLDQLEKHFRSDYLLNGDPFPVFK